MVFIYHYTRPNAGVERTSVEKKKVLNRSNTAFQQSQFTIPVVLRSLVPKKSVFRFYLLIYLSPVVLPSKNVLVLAVQQFPLVYVELLSDIDALHG